MAYEISLKCLSMSPNTLLVAEASGQLDLLLGSTGTGHASTTQLIAKRQVQQAPSVAGPALCWANTMANNRRGSQPQGEKKLTFVRT